jgi:copper chaperone NosL
MTKLEKRLQPLVDRFEEFLDEPIRFRSRILLVLLVIPLALSFWRPLWRISMEAPQYPHGLYLDVYAYKLGGGHGGHDIQEINELNHYIGMRQIARTEFSDLDWIPFALGLLGILTLRAAVVGKVRSLIDLSVLSGYVALFSLIRFVYKLYIFGHDLDPHAPVTIAPFMPVVIGTRQVANFTTHSWPNLGTAFMVVFAGGVAAIAVWHCWVGYREAWGGAAA